LGLVEPSLKNIERTRKRGRGGKESDLKKVRDIRGGDARDERGSHTTHMAWVHHNDQREG